MRPITASILEAHEFLTLEEEGGEYTPPTQEECDGFETVCDKVWADAMGDVGLPPDDWYYLCMGSSMRHGIGVWDDARREWAGKGKQIHEAILSANKPYCFSENA